MEGTEENREKCNFMNQTHFVNENQPRETNVDDEIELSLGLSMNGRFGVDPVSKKLKRSSSVSNLVFTAVPVDAESSHQARGVARGSYAPLVRTSSLPASTDDSRSVRCMEARRKRMEKLKRNVRVVRGKENWSDEGGVGNGNGLHEDGNGSVGVQRFDDPNGIERLNVAESSQGSIGSTRGTSATSDVQSHQMKGAEQNSVTNSSESAEKPAIRAAYNNTTTTNLGGEGLLKNALFDMPYVCTREYGPNSNKIEGFLYRYNKGDEVKIVCVCHGMFLSPSEFVKHGGGGDVAHPLKHIVVNPFPLF